MVSVATLVLACLLLTGVTRAAEYPKVATSLRPVTPGNITVGTPLNMTLTVTAPDLDRVSIEEPFKKDADSTWTLISRNAEPDRKINATEHERKIDYRIATFTTGRVPAPEFVVHYRVDNGPERTSLATADPVEVDSVLPKSASNLEPKGGKPPMALPYPKWIFITVALLCALAAALIAKAVWAKMRRRIIQVVNPPKSLDAWALEQLDVLEHERLVEHKKFKEYYTRLTDVVRSYLGRMFDFQALDMTTYELLERLDDTTMTRKAHETLSSLLDEADLVKFAKLLPEPAACRHALDTARDVVSLTRHHLVTPDKESQASRDTETVEAEK